MTILNLSDNTYDKLVSEQDAVLLEFGAEWCSLCKQMKPILEYIDQAYSGKVTVAMLMQRRKRK